MKNSGEAGQIPLTLPGLELEGDEYGRPDSELRKAVMVTLDSLQRDRLLTERHTGLAMLALELADAVTAGRRGGRASAAAMAGAQLRETLLALPAAAEAGEAERFQEFVETIANGGHDRSAV